LHIGFVKSEEYGVPTRRSVNVCNKENDGFNTFKHC
jgi:hypothetical protein